MLDRLRFFSLFCAVVLGLFAAGVASADDKAVAKPTNSGDNGEDTSNTFKVS